MNCTKTAEPIEMQFGMLSRVGPENIYYMGMYTRCRCRRSWKGQIESLESIVKRRILGVW